jgi:hypothetical protein
MANNIAVSITADVADLQVKRAIMSAELKAATKDLNAFAKEAASTGSTDALRAGMLASAEAAEKARVNIAKVNAELKATAAEAIPATEHITHGFESVSVSVGEMGVHLRETVGVIGEMREAMMAFAEAAIAAFALEQIAEFAKKMGETAEQTKHLSETFGLTVPQIQGLQSAAALTGIGIDTITKALGIFDKNMIAAANGTGGAVIAFKALGISASQGKDQMTLMLDVADKFKNMADGPQKVALAMQLFGRAGKDMIPFLNQGAEGIAHLDSKTQEYSAGLLVATDANKQLSGWLSDVNEKGVALAESTNEQAVAFKGVSNVLTDAFAPMLKEATDGVNSMILAFIESYRKGGDVKEIMTILADVAKVLGQTLYSVGSIAVELYDGLKKVFTGISSLFGDTTKDINGDGDEIKSTFAQITNAIEELRLMIAIGCEAIGTSFQLLCEMISSLWSKTTHNIQAEAEASTRKIKEMYDALRQVQSAEASGVSFNAKSDEKSGIKAPEGSKDFDPDLAKSPKAKKSKATKDDTVSKLQEELDAKKVAWDAAQNAQNTAQAYSLESEAKYWDDALKLKGLSKDAAEAILAKSVEANRKVLDIQRADVQRNYADQLTEAGRNTDAKMAIATQELAWAEKTYTAQSAQYKKVQDEIVKIKREAAQQIEQIELIKGQNEIKAAQDTVAQNERAAKFRVQLGIETNAQAFAQELQFLAQKKAIDDAALANEIAAAAQDPVRLAAINAQKLNLDRQYQAQKTQIEQQSTLERTLFERNAIKSISQQWSQSITQMVTLQQSFASSIGSMWKSLVGSITTMLAQMLEQNLAKFITTEAVKLGVLKASQVSTVAGEVAKAGAGGAASMAAAPFPLNLGAPAFAAEMAGLAGSFGLFSAEGGMGTVPYDNAPFLLHKNEMVLPASLASPFRSMLTSNDNLPSAANSNGGDTHVHINVAAVDGQSVKRMLMDNNGHIADALRKYTRDGGR